MTENDILFKIRSAIFKVYDTLGPDLFESVYESALYSEGSKLGLKVQRSLAVKILYGDIIFSCCL